MPAFAGKPDARTFHDKLDRKLNERSTRGGKSRVIIILKPGGNATKEIARLGGRFGRRLNLLNGQVVELPNDVLRRLADHPGVASIHWDRPTAGAMSRVSATVGAKAVQQQYSLNGAGVGVAIVDSGITSWNNDLTHPGSSSQVREVNNQRVVKFVDFVNGRYSAYDDNGHGTHVAGIIAGNGYNSLGVHAGIAPAAHLVGLKVLDEQGRGVISDVIGAIEYAIANRQAYNIRVINLSVGAAVMDSFWNDPLTLAAKRAVDAGLVVVAAAGNLGKGSDGQPQYGAITAPGNAPWVLTVGASSHQGTTMRTDDVMAPYSSRGPTAYDYAAKPDVVAPGTGVVSLSEPGSLLYSLNSSFLLKGSLSLTARPYLSLTGTSMAAPVVSGTVALMLQANPSLTPNLVKAILQYTAQEHPDYNALTQGAGFLNTKGAVDVARFYRHANGGARFPYNAEWSGKIIWGNQRLSGGVMKPLASAWATTTVWGAGLDSRGFNIVWGTLCRLTCDNIVWGTAEEEAQIVWSTARAVEDNIVWGTLRDTSDNIVWGTARLADNIVWGTSCGGFDCFNIVWGTLRSVADNIVWGTARIGDNIVWGTARIVDNIVWGTASGDGTTWGSNTEDALLFDDPEALPAPLQYWDPMLSGDPLLGLMDTTTVVSTTTTIDGGLLGGGL